MKPLSKEIRNLIGKPGGKPEEKKVAEQKPVEVKATVEKDKIVPVQNTRQICQNCKNYSREKKQCLQVGKQPLKFTPRKGFRPEASSQRGCASPLVYSRGAIRKPAPRGAPVIRFTELMNRLNNMFDWIVIDSPPMVPLADSRVWAGLSDGIMVVIREKFTQVQLLNQAIEAIEPKKLLAL